MTPKSRLSRRPAGSPEFVRRGLADWPASAAHGADALQIYIADSFRVPGLPENPHADAAKFAMSNVSEGISPAGGAVFTE